MQKRPKKNFKNKYLRKHNANNWKHNMMRWRKNMKKEKGLKNKLHKLQADVKNKNWKSPKHFRQKMNQFKKKHGNMYHRYTPAQKKEFDALKNMIKKANKEHYLMKGWNVFKGQNEQWEASHIGKCLKARATRWKDVIENKVWKNPGKIKKDNRKIHKFCDKVEHGHLPFANKGCIMGLEQDYEKLVHDIEDFKQKNKLKEKINHLKNDFNKVFIDFKTKCMNEHMDNTPKCKEYVEEHLKAAHAKFITNPIDEKNHEMKLAFKLEQLATVMKEINSRDFWLNAPDDCKIDHKNGVPIKIDENPLITHGILDNDDEIKGFKPLGNNIGFP